MTTNETTNATIEATTIEATTIEATTIEATTIEATTIEATTIEATTIEATTIEATTIEATTIMATMADIVNLNTAAITAAKEYVSGYGAATTFVRDTLAVYTAQSVIEVLNTLRTSGGKGHDKSLATIVVRELKAVGLTAVSRKGKFVEVTPIVKAETNAVQSAENPDKAETSAVQSAENPDKAEIQRLKSLLADYEKAFSTLESATADMVADITKQRDHALARAASAEKRLAAYAAREKAKKAKAA